MKIFDLQDLPKQDLWEAVYILNLVSPTPLLGSMEEREPLASTEASFFVLLYHWAKCSVQMFPEHCIPCEINRTFKPPIFLSFKADIPYTDQMESGGTFPDFRTILCWASSTRPTLTSSAIWAPTLHPGDCWPHIPCYRVGGIFPFLAASSGDMASWLFIELAFGTCIWIGSPAYPHSLLCVSVTSHCSGRTPARISLQQGRKASFRLRVSVYFSLLW